ncbi:hypothetical protein [Streptomyces sp. NPDC058092]|uniref:hypothetical protein n=1 Tax=Streptomyces sp. NPDC058092 TaxID=3346336 RepID=UPI0036EDE83C
MLRLDLAQVPQLLEIETNTRERLEEAHRMQWLGEVAALKESLRHITDKKKQADRLRRQAEYGESGTGALDDPAAAGHCPCSCSDDRLR